MEMEKNATRRLIKDLSAQAEKPAQPLGARHGRNSCFLLNPIEAATPLLIGRRKRRHTAIAEPYIQSGNTAVLRE
jgi:hypothetical protein